jgi:hypothetical protein
VPDSQVIDAQLPPLVRAQDLLRRQQSSKLFVSELEPFFHLLRGEQLPAMTIRPLRPPSHALALRRKRSSSLCPYQPEIAEVKSPPAAKAEPSPQRMLLRDAELRDTDTVRPQFPCVTQGSSQKVLPQMRSTRAV